MTYSEKLRDPRWQKKRLEVMDRNGFRCQNCTSSNHTLNVHHCWYERGLDPWEYPDNAYQCLCEDCHEKAEAYRLAISKMLFIGSPSELLHLAAQMRGAVLAMGENGGSVSSVLAFACWEKNFSVIAECFVSGKLIVSAIDDDTELKRKRFLDDLARVGGSDGK